VRLLLDTHALLWFLEGSDKLRRAARQVIEDEANTVFVSAVSAMEVTTKVRLGKLASAEALALNFEVEILVRGFLPLPITLAHAERAGGMPGEHRDPFDRLLIAQALVEDLTLVSNEAIFDGFGVKRLW
jgi:PIN domain nuclease of toxin-antitoxin system